MLLDQIQEILSKSELIEEGLKFLDGNAEETVAVMTSAMLELGQIHRLMDSIKEAMLVYKQQIQEAELMTEETKKLIDCCQQLDQQTDKVFPNHRALAPGHGPATKVLTKPTSGAAPAASQAATGKGGAVVPVLTYVTISQFDSIPKYMKGRMTYDTFKAAIDEFNQVLTAKYAFLSKGFPATGSVKDKNKYKTMKSLESKDTKNVKFLVADDLKGTALLKTESNRKTMFAMFRHLQLIREIRGPGPVLRYAAQ